jgi:NitT/TauT family transport system permease protein
VTPADVLRERDTQRSTIPGYLRSPPRRVATLSATAWTFAMGLGVVVLVELVARLGLVARTTLLPFTEMAAASLRLLTDGSFYDDALVPSLVAIIVSFILSSALGVVLGYAIWRVTGVRRALDPYLTAYYAVPTFALYPLLVAMWGTGRGPIVLLATTFSIVAVIMNSMNGYDSVPAVVRKLGQSLKVTERQYFFKFFLPYAVPYILVGLRLAALYSLLSVLAAEFLLSDQGIGFFVSNAYTRFAIADMYGGILIILVIAIAVERLITWMVNRLTWMGSLQ